MDAILNEYNKFNTKPIYSIKELEDVSEIVYDETISQTESEITFRRFCSCCARSKEGRLHPIHYFVVDCGKLDANGDVDDDLVVVECDLL